MKCPSCSSDLPEGAGFCAFCGERVHRCPSCDRAYGTDVEFCGFCGTEISKPNAFRGKQDTDQKRGALFQTSPGRPGPETGKPTFVLPAESDERDPNVYGFIFDPDNPSTRHKLSIGDNTLGAGHNNDIVVDQPAVSWNHALIICRNGKVFAQDSASTNGTFINGKRVERPQQLENGDTITFGNISFQVWLKIKYRD